MPNAVRSLRCPLLLAACVLCSTACFVASPAPAPAKKSPAAATPSSKPFPPPVVSKPAVEPWVNAQKAAGRIGDVRVRVTGAAYDRVRGESFGKVESEKKHLIIRLQIDNLSDVRLSSLTSAKPSGWKARPTEAHA